MDGTCGFLLKMCTVGFDEGAAAVREDGGSAGFAGAEG
jgi:hypothetical protein